MADMFDQAQEVDALFRKLALDRATGSNQPGPGATHCDECGDEIPEKRRLAVPGCRYCVECLEAIERRSRK